MAQATDAPGMSVEDRYWPRGRVERTYASLHGRPEEYHGSVDVWTSDGLVIRVPVETFHDGDGFRTHVAARVGQWSRCEYQPAGPCEPADAREHRRARARRDTRTGVALVSPAVLAAAKKALAEELRP